MVNVEPDDLETAGSVHLKALADVYDEVLETSSRASESRVEAFISTGSPSAGNSGSSHPAASPGSSQSTALYQAFDEAYEMFYSVTYQTSLNIRAMGEVLVDIAENHRLNDGDIEDSFEEFEEDVRSGDHDVYDDPDNAPPPSPEEKDNAEEHYEEELSGS